VNSFTVGSEAHHRPVGRQGGGGVLNLTKGSSAELLHLRRVVGGVKLVPEENQLSAVAVVLTKEVGQKIELHIGREPRGGLTNLIRRMGILREFLGDSGEKSRQQEQV